MTAIEFEHVSKQYRLGLVSTKTLSHDIRRWWLTSVRGKEDPYLKIGETNDRSTKGNSEYVWALRDIDFKVEQGDVVGIIGKNGAGKSTLLKLLSRVTGPTTGTIRAHGRIGSLLEVGTGFHGEMTGRENIFMNGAILGMTRNEIQAKLDEIIDFSGCERYIDTPVKRYSSGMTVRLGFAVAAFLEPEILVVDEVLAVGDAEFQKKAIGKMKDVSQGQGRTVLFVSHNMASVRNLCKHGVLLNNGFIEYIGDVEDVVERYQANCRMIQNAEILTRKDRMGNGKLRLESVMFRTEHSDNADNIISGETCVVRVKIRKYNWKKGQQLDQCTIAFNDVYGNRALVLSNSFLKKEILIDSTKDSTIVEFKIDRLPLNAGQYSMAFYLSDKNGDELDWIDNICTIEVMSGDFYRTGNIIRKGLGVFLTDFDVENV